MTNATNSSKRSATKAVPHAMLMVLALSFILLITAPFDSLRDDFLDGITDSNPSTIIAAANNVTIYLHDGVHENDSIFRTNTLQRFGTGSFNHHVHDLEYSCSDNSCSSNNNSRLNHINADSSPSSPCLVVSKYYAPKFGYCQHDALRCSYPQCKTMIEGDEYCQLTTFNVRNYYSHGNNHQFYLPLGPRFDSWSVLQRLQQSPEFVMKPPSSRRYAFNAIFTKGTGMGRRKLAKLLERMNHTLPIYTAITTRWTSMTQFKRADENKLNPQTYMEVVLDSIFTLSPAGHNPECFRMFEAIEAGSIPVLVKEELYSPMNGECVEPLHHWYDAPILVLESWDDLFPTVERLLLGDLLALDKMQIDLKAWYDGYMRKIVRDFEEFLMQPFEPSL